MNSDRYRLYFSLVILLFVTQVFYRYIGEEKFTGIVSEVYSYVMENGVEYSSSSPGGKQVRRYETNYLGRIGIGAYLFKYDGNDNSIVISHENEIQHRLQYVLVFRSWGGDDKDFPTMLAAQLSDLDITPIITWEPWERNFDDATAIQTDFTLESIVGGEHDEYISSWAKAAKELDTPIILRFAHEQSTYPGERSWYPWQGKPATYKNAYRRIVYIFRSVGALNVKFMWNPVAFWPETTLDYYPGAGIVDYLGMTVLNHGVDSGEEGDRWKQCKELFEDQYDVLRTVNKPIIVTEFASSEVGGSKAAWYRECFRMIKANPYVIGVVSLEADADTSYPSIDWRIGSSYESLKSYREQISDTIFR